MCGVAGFTYRNEELIRKMTDSIRHRGPDDEGIYTDDNVSLGHRRLSILDLSQAGHQPMCSVDGRLVIVHNGEVYNFRDIRTQLEVKGYRFKSDSDTEVILYAYSEWGRECLEKFIGMFAFAIWDSVKKEFFIARDRLGVKPLYYMQKGGDLFFASEIKAFKTTKLMDDSLDPAALDLFFSFRFTPGPQTVLKDVKRLEPGHFMEWKEGGLKISKYWDVDISSPDGSGRKSEADYVEEFLDIFRDAVRLRLVSDVPVGAYLSGGLDSSFIVGIMAGIAVNRVSTFSVGLPGGRDESLYAQIVARHFKTDHHPLQVKANAVEAIPDVMWHLDEPLSDAATIPTYLMSGVTKREVTVILSGEGADEQLGGYDKYKPLLYPYMVRGLIPRPIFRGLAPFFNAYPKLYRASEYLGNLNNPSRAYLRFNSVFLSEERDSLFADREMREAALSGNDYDIVSSFLNREGDFLNRLLLLDMKTWLPDDLLLKNDKMTMAHGVEARTPFLDHRLVEFLMTVPSQYKIRWFREKHLLRKAMSGLVPDLIAKRKKQGFTVPIHKWIAEEMKNIVDELFDRENIESLGIFDYGFVKGMPEKDLSNVYNLRQFWALFSFLAWHRYFLHRD